MRFMGAGHSRGRMAALLAGVVIVVLALSVALRPGSGDGSTPNTPPPSGIGAESGGPTTLPSGPAPTGTLPAVPTATSSDAPVTAPPGIVARRIRIARLGINLQIVEGDGIEAPMGKAAHYPGTGWPDGGVNIYLYAHAQTGMFLTLWDAKVGDDVFLDLADGTTRHYVVTRVLPKVPWDALQYVAATAPERLTLQTSTSYTPTAPRFIVLAAPAPDASPSVAPSP
jgi:LPXTG-site transpeptidase (sortase) family protein